MTAGGGRRVAGVADAQSDDLARGSDGITIRRIETPEEYDACVAIQRETWGEDFVERVPASILRIAQYIGGVTAGAFSPDGELLGFVFGMSGIREGRLVHWSDLLAVRTAARDRGLGRRLKLFQRATLRPLGIEAMYWTFDPLVARNAHLNLTRLAARVTEYVPDMYGASLRAGTDDALGTDRFIVRWSVIDELAAEGDPAAHGDSAEWGDETTALRGAEPEFGAIDPRALSGDAELPAASRIRISVPEDIEAIGREDPAAARRWRERTRQAFLWYLQRGYEVTGFQRHGPTGGPFYQLGRP